MHQRAIGGTLSTPSGILDELKNSLGTIVLPDVEFPTVVPDSLETVLQTVQWCRDHSWRILPVGRGHTFSDEHYVPDGVLTVLSSSRRGMSEVSAADLVVEVEVGVPAAAVLSVVEAEGLRLEHWPADYQGTVGGLLCGSHGTRYRGIVLGSVFVDGTGRVLNLGGAVRKDVSGFDGTSVFLGSHGSIGWLDRVILRLKPKSTQIRERVSLPPSTQSKEFSGLHRQVALAFDPEDIFLKPKG
jgi:FAD/FMN-containing dehydrogenase